jgi:hypothetical protein
MPLTISDQWHLTLARDMHTSVDVLYTVPTRRRHDRVRFVLKIGKRVVP